jgi:hypothetical protein
MSRVLPPLLRVKGFCLDVLHPRFVRWTKPLTPSLPLGTLTDLGRSKSELIAENALLRQQLIMLSWQVKQPAGSSGSSPFAGNKVMAVPILAGLHHDSQRVA